MTFLSSPLLALQFLTVIPVKIKVFKDIDLARSAVYFPVIGFLLGLILVVVAKGLVFLNFNTLTASVIIVAVLAVTTGSIHLDGLSDTSDALLSRKSKDEMLDIMRDPHIGAMGAVAIILALMLKVVLISSLRPSIMMPALVLMCTISRTSLVMAMHLFPYARKEGKAKTYMEQKDIKTLVIAATLATLFVAFTWHIRGLVTLLVTILFVYLMGKSIVRRFGGITGDILGAMVETSEIIVLLGVSILGSVKI
jgi:adenosylcobinamide-GDP ribazoletransferase